MKNDDKAYVIINSSQMAKTLIAFGHNEKISSKILIIGGGNIGYNLAKNIEETADDVHFCVYPRKISQNATKTIFPLKTSEFLPKCPNASECIQRHLNASEHIRTHPNASEQVRTGQNMSPNLKKLTLEEPRTRRGTSKLRLK